MKPDAGARYETSVARARTRLAHHGHLRAVTTGGADGETTALFLIHFHAAAIALARPMPGWLRRAGERCREVGYPELGHGLEIHARQHAGRHEQLLADVRALVERWNETRGHRLDAADLETAEPTSAAMMYRMVHEDTIASDAPYRQLAFEHETGLATIRFAPRLLEACSRAFGDETARRLRFLPEHVGIDLLHTHTTRSKIDGLLESDPELLMPLLGAGEAALGVYGAFVEDCWRRARRTLEACWVSTVA